MLTMRGEDRLLQIFSTLRGPFGSKEKPTEKPVSSLMYAMFDLTVMFALRLHGHFQLQIRFCMRSFCHTRRNALWL